MHNYLVLTISPGGMS